MRAQRWVLLLLLSVTLVRTAWLADDAAITLRTALNWLHGYGAVFNPVERVQAYTHPLWFGALSLIGAVTGNVFSAAFGLSLATSLIVAWLVGWRLGDTVQGAVALGVLALSKAFIDFSTSGLENPLSHLWILLMVLAVQPTRAPERRLRDAGLLTAAMWLTRPDAVVLLGPVLLVQLLQVAPQISRRRLGLALLPGLLLVATWSGTSLCYYGFLVPNTAFAKLGSGLGLAERTLQGLRYLGHTAQTDSLTLLALLAGLFRGVWLARTRGWLRYESGLALGIALHLGFVVTSGGDFMAGRLLTPALVAAVALLVAPLPTGRGWHAVLALGAVLGAIGLPQTWLSPSVYRVPFLTPEGIADERGYWSERTALLHPMPEVFVVPPWQGSPSRVKVRCTDLGLRGTAAGPTWHLLDPCGLADPLLARMPAPEKADKRIGHQHRDVPPGYAESVLRAESGIADARLRAADNQLRQITRGPLWDAERWRLIVRWNLRGGRLPE